MGTVISPEAKEAINALLRSHGLDLDELLKNHSTSKALSRTEEWITMAEAAEIYRKSRSTIYRLLRKYDIETHKLSNARGGRVLINARSLQQHIKSLPSVKEYFENPQK